MSDPFDYIESRDDADELIADFGRPVSITRITPGTGPAWDPGQGTMTATPTFAVQVDYTMKQIQAGAVLAKAERWLIATNGGALASVLPSDKLDGRDILDVKPLQPSGVVVLFDVQVRT